MTVEQTIKRIERVIELIRLDAYTTTTKERAKELTALISVLKRELKNDSSND
jgi:hypothetical protein